MGQGKRERGSGKEKRAPKGKKGSDYDKNPITSLLPRLSNAGFCSVAGICHKRKRGGEVAECGEAGFGKRSGEEGLRGSKEGEETSFCQYWMQKNPFTVLSYGTSEKDVLPSTAHLNIG